MNSASGMARKFRNFLNKGVVPSPTPIVEILLDSIRVILLPVSPILFRKMLAVIQPALPPPTITIFSGDVACGAIENPVNDIRIAGGRNICTIMLQLPASLMGNDQHCRQFRCTGNDRATPWQSIAPLISSTLSLNVTIQPASADSTVPA